MVVIRVVAFALAFTVVAASAVVASEVEGCPSSNCVARGNKCQGNCVADTYCPSSNCVSCPVEGCEGKEAQAARITG